jgi:serine/threonine-protein kinase SRPK3
MGMYFISDVDIYLTVYCGARHQNYALKILTAYATRLNYEGRLRELQTLEAIAEVVKSGRGAPYVPELVDSFEIAGPHGDHLCFLLHLRSTDVRTFQRTVTPPSRTLLLHDVKMVILHALYALQIIHELGLAVTGISSS